MATPRPGASSAGSETSYLGHNHDHNVRVPLWSTHKTSARMFIHADIAPRLSPETFVVLRFVIQGVLPRSRCDAMASIDQIASSRSVGIRAEDCNHAPACYKSWLLTGDSS